MLVFIMSFHLVWCGTLRNCTTTVRELNSFWGESRLNFGAPFPATPRSTPQQASTYLYI